MKIFFISIFFLTISLSLFGQSGLSDSLKIQIAWTSRHILEQPDSTAVRNSRIPDYKLNYVETCICRTQRWLKTNYVGRVSQRISRRLVMTSRDTYPVYVTLLLSRDSYSCHVTVTPPHPRPIQLSRSGTVLFLRMPTEFVKMQ